MWLLRLGLAAATLLIMMYDGDIQSAEHEAYCQGYGINAGVPGC